MDKQTIRNVSQPQQDRVLIIILVVPPPLRPALRHSEYILLRAPG